MGYAMLSFARSAFFAALLLPAPFALAGPSLNFTQVWSYYASSRSTAPNAQETYFDKSAAEIVAHDPATQRVFVVNRSSRSITRPA